MNNNKIEVRTKELKSNGDIVIDDFYFHKSNWSRIVPNLCSMFESVFDKILTGDSFKSIVDMNIRLHVSKIESNETSDKDSINHYTFFCNTNNGHLNSENDIVLKPNINMDLIEEVKGLAMITLHGTGEYNVITFFISFFCMSCM